MTLSSYRKPSPVLVLALTVGALQEAPAAAQAPPPAANAPSVTATETLEPAVETSRSAAQGIPAAAAPAADAGDAAPSRARRGPAAPAPAPAASRRVIDRVDLDATQITGNRELPRVLYIVPWKRSDLGDLAGRPVNSLLDEVLAPVDRDVFRRETRYFEALQSAPAAGGAAEAGKAGAGGTVPRSPSGDSVRDPSQAPGTGGN